MTVRLVVLLGTVAGGPRHRGMERLAHLSDNGGRPRLPTSRHHRRSQSLLTAEHAFFSVAAVIEGISCGERHTHASDQRHKRMRWATAPQVQRRHHDRNNHADPGDAPAPHLRDQPSAKSGSGRRRVWRRFLGQTHRRHCASPVQFAHETRINEMRCQYTLPQFGMSVLSPRPLGPEDNDLRSRYARSPLTLFDEFCHGFDCNRHA